jgi:hypothetical protein
MEIKFEIVVKPGISQGALPDKEAYVLAAADDYIKPQC